MRQRAGLDALPTKKAHTAGNNKKNSREGLVSAGNWGYVPQDATKQLFCATTTGKDAA